MVLKNTLGEDGFTIFLPHLPFSGLPANQWQTSAKSLIPRPRLLAQPNGQIARACFDVDFCWKFHQPESTFYLALWCLKYQNALIGFDWQLNTFGCYGSYSMESEKGSGYSGLTNCIFETVRGIPKTCWVDTSYSLFARKGTEENKTVESGMPSKVHMVTRKNMGLYIHIYGLYVYIYVRIYELMKSLFCTQ